jgi:hypothetical protein
MQIPSALQSTFRIAKTSDIRSWSYGGLTAPRDTSATFQDNVKGTLFDQRIFGPIRDFKCACGKYSGDDFANMVCDICGVKVTSKRSRSTRFGHIDFFIDIAHPLSPEMRLSCFPVVPADFIQSPGGQRLQALYDQLIEGNLRRNYDDLAISTNTIVECLTPLVVMLNNWSIVTPRDTLARGIALEVRA